MLEQLGFERVPTRTYEKIIDKKKEEKEELQKWIMEKIEKEVSNYKKDNDKKINDELMKIKKIEA